MASSELGVDNWWTNVGLLAAAFVGSLMSYFAGKRNPPEKPLANLHIGDAQITDMAPIIAMGSTVIKIADENVRIANATERVADAVEGILILMQSEMKDRREREEELARDETRRVKEENRRMKEENDAVRERLMRAERAGQGERNDIMKTTKG